MATFHTVPIVIQIEADAADDDEHVDELARSLRTELAALTGVHDARSRPSRDAATDLTALGARRGELLTIGALVLAVLPVAVPEIVEFLKEWLLRPGYRPVKLRIPGLELEYDPRTMNATDIGDLVQELQTTVFQSPKD